MSWSTAKEHGIEKILEERLAGKEAVEAVDKLELIIKEGWFPWLQ